MKISLVVPVFNEEEAIPFFHDAVRSCAGLRGHEVEIVFVNDGSNDHTADAIKRLVAADPLILLVNFSRNFGKEPALFAGIDFATGDAIIPIDVDLQDPIDVVPLLIEQHLRGHDVVLAKRANRKSDSHLKRLSAQAFYKIINRLSDSRIEENVGDFRLMSRRVADTIRALPEKKLFMKGLLSWVGFSTTTVEYARPPRIAGQSKFNGWKLWNFALEGITSFSTAPLRIWTYLGGLIAIFAICYGLWMIIQKIIWGNPVPGYPSLIAAILLLGGVQLIGIGVLGEYVGRIYMETKQRPRYIIESVHGNHPDKAA